MKTKITGIISITLMLLAFAPMHDYHVTISEIVYSDEKSSLSLAHKLFIDDLEQAMEKDGLKGLSIDLEKKNPEHIREVTTFIMKHINLQINDKKVKLKYVGFEWEDHHGLWFYFEAQNIKALNSMTITNDIFTDLFPTQENIHYVSKGDEKKTLLLKKDLTNGTVSL